MAAYDKPRLKSSFKASVDLSAKQYFAVKADSETTVVLAGGASGDQITGILMNKPVAGVAAEIAGSGGGALLEITGTIAIDGLIMITTGGTGIAATGAGAIVSARAKKAGVTGDIIPVDVIDAILHA